MSATLTREIHHHRQLHHPHVIQLYEVIATENHIWLVTELCSGGELFDYLVEKGRVSESETRIIFGQLCLAVAYIHRQGDPPSRPQARERSVGRKVPRQTRRFRFHT
jgi:serine/threonine protein kinase